MVSGNCKVICSGRSGGRTPWPPLVLHSHYKPTNAGHVAPKHWATCPHTIHCQRDTCQHPIRQQPSNQQLPHHHHMIVQSYHVTVQTVQTVRTCTVSIPKFCLFGLADRLRYLLHTNSVCESKYTTRIRKTRQTQWNYFHRIPNTLKIEQNLIP
jgi:hypothetical protein